GDGGGVDRGRGWGGGGVGLWGDGGESCACEEDYVDGRQGGVGDAAEGEGVGRDGEESCGGRRVFLQSFDFFDRGAQIAAWLLK
ncbi:unnamed protein product, partial [Linum tenue]